MWGRVTQCLWKVNTNPLSRSKELLSHVYSGSPLSAGHILHIFLKVMGYLPMTFHSSQAAQFRQEYNSSSSLPFPFEFYVSSLLCAMHQSTQIQATPHFSFLWWPWSCSSGQPITPGGMWWDVPLPCCWKAWLTRRCFIIFSLLLLTTPLLLCLSNFKRREKGRKRKSRIWIACNKLSWSLLFQESFIYNTSNNLLIYTPFSYTITSLSSLSSSAW